MHEAFVHGYEQRLSFLLKGVCPVYFKKKVADPSFLLIVHQRNLHTTSAMLVAKMG